MHGEAPETMETLRAALLAAEHRATTAEATTRALMDDAAAMLATLRDAAVAEAHEECARVADAAAAQHRTREGDDSHDARVARYAAAVLRDVAEDIRARGGER